MLVLPQPVVDLDQEAVNVLTIAEIWGMIARFLIENHLICSPGMLRCYLSGLIDFVQRRLERRHDTKGVSGCPQC